MQCECVNFTTAAKSSTVSFLKLNKRHESIAKYCSNNTRKNTNNNNSIRKTTTMTITTTIGESVGDEDEDEKNMNVVIRADRTNIYSEKKNSIRTRWGISHVFFHSQPNQLGLSFARTS